MNAEVERLIALIPRSAGRIPSPRMRQLDRLLRGFKLEPAVLPFIEREISVYAKAFHDNREKARRYFYLGGD
jgi:hypothetical protein